MTEIFVGFDKQEAFITKKINRLTLKFFDQEGKRVNSLDYLPEGHRRGTKELFEKYVTGPKKE